MTAAAVTADPSSLRFAKSESKAVGMQGRLIDTLRNNSPRIVAGLKMAGDIAAGLTFDPFLMTYAGFSIAGRVIAMVYGSKSHQQKLAPKGPALGNSWKDGITKVMHPSKYPVESSAGLSVIGEVFEAAFGASQFFKFKEVVKAGGKIVRERQTGFTALIGGMVAVWAYANIVYGKEARKDEAPAHGNKEPLTFGHSESKPVGLAGRIRQTIKDNPLVVSSLMQFGVVTAVLVGGLIEGYKPAYIAYAVIGMVACAIQALFVRKNEFNVEGAQQGQQEKGPWSKSPAENSFEKRLVQQRRDGDKLAAQPT